MPVSIAWVEQLTPCMPTTPSRSGCAWQKALGSNKQGETCVSLVDSIISRSGYPATPTREKIAVPWPPACPAAGDWRGLVQR